MAGALNTPIQEASDLEISRSVLQGQQENQPENGFEKASRIIPRI